MLIYYVMLGVPLFITVLFRLYKQKTLKKDLFNPTVLVFFICFFLILILRDYSIGADTLGYKELYENIGRISFGKMFADTDREYGFMLFTKLFRFINPSFRIYLAIVTLLSLLPIAWYYQTESEYPLLTIVLFVTVAPFTMYFSGLRQIMAMGLGIVAWQMAKNKKLIWFLVIVAVAIMFHASAIILFVMYPLYKVRITTKWLFAVVPAIILIYIFNKPIFSFLTTFLWKEYGKIEDTGSYTVLILLVALAVYAFFIPDKDRLDKDTIALRNLLLLSIVLQCFAPIHPLAMRMNYYFLLFIPILIPKIAMRSKFQYKELTEASVLVMLVVFTAYFFYHASAGSDNLNVYHYIGCW